MPEETDAAALTAVVLREEESRQAPRPRPKPASSCPTTSCPGVGGDAMPMREGLRVGGLTMIISLLLVAVIETFDQVALQVLAPDIQRSLDVSKTTLQGLTSFGGVVLVLATLPFAWLADRYVRTRILAGATFIWAVFMALTGAVNNAVAMAFVRAGAGFGASARIPISPSLIADQYPIGVRTRMFAIENLGRPTALVDRPVHRRRGRGLGRRRRRLAVGDGRGRDPGGVRRDRRLLFVREPARGRNEQEAVLGQLLDDSDDPPVRLSLGRGAAAQGARPSATSSSASACSGFALVSVPVRLSFLFDETYDFSAYKRGWVLSLTYLPALLVIPIAGRYGDRLFRRDPRNAVRMFGALVIALRRVPHHRLAVVGRSSR